MYESLIRPLLFRLPADQSHELAKAALRWPAVGRVLGAGSRLAGPRLATDLAGIPLTSPIGLAPGFDKDGDIARGLSELGFGYVTVGSITRQPRTGNPHPWLARSPEQLSVSNCMGMPNAGIDAAVETFARAGRARCPLIASVAGFSVAELVEMAARIEPHVAAVEIGLICANTEGMDQLGEMAIFTELMRELARRKRKPVIIKLPPHHDDSGRSRVRGMVQACLANAIDGVSVSGTHHQPDSRLSMGTGGVAGRPVYGDALRIVADVAEWAEGGLAIKAAGGVFTGRHAYEMLAAGATTVELYSAFIYRGWAVAGHIQRELLAILDDEGLASVRDIPRRQPALAF